MYIIYTTTYVCKQRVVALLSMDLLSKMRKMQTITSPDASYNKKHCIQNYLEYLVNIGYVSATWPAAAREEKRECS